MISVRIVNVDYYMCYPIINLDVKYSEFRGIEVRQVPVIQIYGSNQTGQKTCLNIHGVFPYIYIPYDASEPAGNLSYKIATELDKALNISLGQASSNTVHIHNIVLVSGIPIYGYHGRQHQFFKIFFYNPAILKKASSLLENGAILGKKFQPHETHINYILQFMIDYNLHGMSLINISRAMYRSTENDPDFDNLPSNLKLGKDILRRSVCKYELDVLASDITNKDEVSSGNLAINPGISALWEDERQRRRNKEMDSQISFSLTQHRENIRPTTSHLVFEQKLTSKLLREYKSDDTLDNSVYPAETPEDAEVINASEADFTILDTTSLDETIKETQFDENDAKFLAILQNLKDSADVEDGSILSQEIQEQVSDTEDQNLDPCIGENDSIWEDSFWEDCGEIPDHHIPQIDGHFDSDSSDIYQKNTESNSEIYRPANEVYLNSDFNLPEKMKLNPGINKLILTERKRKRSVNIKIISDVCIKCATDKKSSYESCKIDDNCNFTYHKTELDSDTVLNDISLPVELPSKSSEVLEKLEEDFMSIINCENSSQDTNFEKEKVVINDVNLFSALSPEILEKFEIYNENKNEIIEEHNKKELLKNKSDVEDYESSEEPDLNLEISLNLPKVDTDYVNQFNKILFNNLNISDKNLEEIFQHEKKIVENIENKPVFLENNVDNLEENFKLLNENKTEEKIANLILPETSIGIENSDNLKENFKHLNESNLKQNLELLNEKKTEELLLKNLNEKKSEENIENKSVFSENKKEIKNSGELDENFKLLNENKTEENIENKSILPEKNIEIEYSDILEENFRWLNEKKIEEIIETKLVFIEKKVEIENFDNLEENIKLLKENIENESVISENKMEIENSDNLEENIKLLKEKKNEENVENTSVISVKKIEFDNLEEKSLNENKTEENNENKSEKNQIEITNSDDKNEQEGILLYDLFISDSSSDETIYDDSSSYSELPKLNFLELNDFENEYICDINKTEKTIEKNEINTEINKLENEKEMVKSEIKLKTDEIMNQYNLRPTKIKIKNGCKFCVNCNEDKKSPKSNNKNQKELKKVEIEVPLSLYVACLQDSPQELLDHLQKFKLSPERDKETQNEIKNDKVTQLEVVVSINKNEQDKMVQNVSEKNDLKFEIDPTEFNTNFEEFTAGDEINHLIENLGKMLKEEQLKNENIPTIFNDEISIDSPEFNENKTLNNEKTVDDNLIDEEKSKNLSEMDQSETNKNDKFMKDLLLNKNTVSNSCSKNSENFGENIENECNKSDCNCNCHKKFNIDAKYNADKKAYKIHFNCTTVSLFEQVKKNVLHWANLYGLSDSPSSTSTTSDDETEVYFNFGVPPTRNPCYNLDGQADSPSDSTSSVSKIDLKSPKVLRKKKNSCKSVGLSKKMLKKRRKIKQSTEISTEETSQSTENCSENTEEEVENGITEPKSKNNLCEKELQIVLVPLEFCHNSKTTSEKPKTRVLLPRTKKYSSTESSDTQLNKNIKTDTITISSDDNSNEQIQNESSSSLIRSFNRKIVLCSTSSSEETVPQKTKPPKRRSLRKNRLATKKTQDILQNDLNEHETVTENIESPNLSDKLKISPELNIKKTNSEKQTSTKKSPVLDKPELLTNSDEIFPPVKENPSKKPVVLLERLSPKQLAQLKYPVPKYNKIIKTTVTKYTSQRKERIYKVRSANSSPVKSRRKVLSPKYSPLHIIRSPKKHANFAKSEYEPEIKKPKNNITGAEENTKPEKILTRSRSQMGAGELQLIPLDSENLKSNTNIETKTIDSIKKNLFNTTVIEEFKTCTYENSSKSVKVDVDFVRQLKEKEELFVKELEFNCGIKRNVNIVENCDSLNISDDSNNSNKSSIDLLSPQNNKTFIKTTPPKVTNFEKPIRRIVKKKDKKPILDDYFNITPEKKLSFNASNFYSPRETLSQQNEKILTDIDNFNTKCYNLTVAELYDLKRDYAPQPSTSKKTEEFEYTSPNCSFVYNDISLMDNTFLSQYSQRTSNNSNIWMPKYLPPTKDDIKNSLAIYNIPENRFQEPFYSECSDVTGKVNVGNNVLKISSTTAKDFEIFESSIGFGIEKWRKEKLKEYCSPEEILKNIKITLASSKKIIITPVNMPPTRQEIISWINIKCNETSKEQIEKIEKPRIIIPQSPGNESLNDSLTLSPCTPMSPISTPKGSQNSTPKCSQNSTPTSSQSSIISKRPKRKGNLQKKVLFSQTKFVNNTESSGNDITGVTLNNTHGFQMSFENLQDAKAISEHQYLTILVVEVHIRTRGDFYPDPQYDSIRALFYSILNDVPENSFLPCKETGIIVVDTLPGSPVKQTQPILDGTGPNCEINYVKSENELIDEFVKLIRKWDPDIFVGFEIELLSWGYLIERCNVIGINLPVQISRTNPDIVRNKTGENKQEELRLNGRIILDAWRLFRHEIALQSYTFENLMFHILHQRVPAHSFKNLSFFWEYRSNYYRYITVNYYITRVEGILKLLYQLDIIGRTSELARLFGIQFYEVLSRGSQFRVESMMLRLAKPLNFIPVSPNVQQRAKMRAPESLPLILEPESRFYADPVIVLDFQSLYPSIIIAYNYCFSTCIGRVEKLGTNSAFEFGACQLKLPRSKLNKLQGKINFSPCGVGFVKSEVRQGILPRMLKEILETRLMVKSSMKENKENKILQRVLHNRQLGLKLIANVTYGYTSANFSGRMPCIEVGDSVVSKGRETLERAIHMIETTDRWRARVVYGDTDSLFVLVPGRSREDAFKIGAEIAEAVTNDNPPPVKLKLEKVYQPCILQTKKRYVGYMYESPEQKEPEYNAKGIETVRRDGCPAVAKMLEKTLRTLFETRDVSLVKRYVVRQFEKLNSGRASIQDLIFAREFRGFSGYRPGACVPALELAKKWIAVDKRREPRRSERVPYIVVHGPPGLPLIRLVKCPRELLNPEQGVFLRPNAVYYITKVIAPALNRCLGLIGADVLTWYNEMPRKQLQILPTEIHSESNKKSTISQYFATMSCIVCNKQTRDGLCDDCINNPQTSVVVLQEKLRHWEGSYDDVQQICKSCCGRVEYTDCTSLDCPVLYRSSQTKKDLRQVPFVRNLLSKF